MLSTKLTGTLLAAVGAVLIAEPARAQETTRLNGAGATFPAPIYQKWLLEYHTLHPDVEVNYQPIGSGGGIRQFTERTVDFGASDGPMTDAQVQAVNGNVYHLPTVLGSVVPTYNIPGVTAKLRFTGEVLAGISYQLSQNVRLLADLDNTSLQGSVTGSTTAPRKVTQAALHTQFTF